ncbi:LolA-like outer membrane lipoprotein chaperone [Hydrogenimonas cancrithermarum]|uniref:Outer-membrane lipoprotein carrier protein n=1 Tax=Hydrogenimonas cancrithermarum TaxID=2993563 RepID=A0ABN6WT72_9BACT|nr:LolA-like outer membrane lipoprotein chaperone [Hydrogenimonas cancrithermarum]BDY12176.1 hypothetical protein HCR_04880 [Hydrogenimonas cancrithermarum]
MKKTALYILFTSSLFASLSIPGQIRASFHQTVVNSENNQTLDYRGLVWMRLPNEAKWIYKEPVEKIICLTQNRAWIIEPELEQATLFQLEKAIPLLKILKKAKKSGPNRYNAEYEGVEYRIVTNNKGQLKQIEYTDEMGNRVTLAFENVETEPFDDSFLKCTIPEEYDLIDGRY